MDLKKELEQQETADLELSDPSTNGSMSSTIETEADRNTRVTNKEKKHSIVEFNKKIDDIADLLDQVKRSSSELENVTDVESADISKPDTKSNEKRQRIYKQGMQNLERARVLLSELSDSLQLQREQEDAEREIGEDSSDTTEKKKERTYSANFRKMESLLERQECYYIQESQHFQEASTLQKDFLNQKIRRMCRYLNPNLTEDQIQQAISAGEEGIQSMALNSESEYDALLADAEEKHQMTLEFERGTQELLELTKEMQALVEAEGLKLNSIYDTVKSAREDVANGVNNLVKANEHARTTKKCVCCLILLCGIGLVVLLLILLGILKIT